jgi:metal-responsive CopG/Arc/MetJ family transcriptional regulator
MITSRSEGIRLAIREYLKKEVHVAKILNYFEEDEEKK